jgi:hypothetical protein
VTSRRIVGTALGFLLTFVLVFAFVPPDRARVDRVVLLAGVVYVYLAVRRRLGVGSRPEARAPRAPDPFGELSPAAEQDVRLARLDASLVRATESSEQFTRVTRPMLRRLTTERLLMRSGIDVTADPAGARRLMGEELWEIFSAPADQLVPAPAPERLRGLVERLERL